MLINEIRKMIVAGKPSNWLVQGRTKRFYFQPEQRTKLTDSLVVGDYPLFYCKKLYNVAGKVFFRVIFFLALLAKLWYHIPHYIEPVRGQAQMDVNFWSLDLKSVGRR